MKIHIESYGCTMNQGEAGEMATRLGFLGFEVRQGIHAAFEHEVYASVVYTCTVIESTQIKMLRRLIELAQDGRRLIVTGCMANVQAELILEAVSDACVVKIEDQFTIPSLLADVEEQNGKRDWEAGAKEFQVAMDGKVATIPISKGCTGKCTYCITRLARGAHQSQEPGAIIEKARQAIKGGAMEIRLTSQDNGLYGNDIGTSLAELLEEVCSIPGEFRVRVGMMNPTGALRDINALVDVFSRHEKLFRFLHIPLQSGSGRILQAMSRNYDVEQFCKLIRIFRKALPDISLATDIITGFPGERDEDHHASMKLLQELKPASINITRFSSRPGTVAANLPDRVQGVVSKQRSRELTSLRLELSRKGLEGMVGSIQRVLVVEPGIRPGTLLGRTDAYRPVVLPYNPKILGTFQDIRIVGNSDVCLIGED